jgi:LysM repeat protein
MLLFIKAKDTFYSLAEYYYGTDKEADELKKLNPEVDPKRLKIGQMIRVPCNPVQINQ